MAAVFVCYVMMTLEDDRELYRHFPTEEVCMERYFKASGDFHDAKTPMEREHCKQLKDFYWAAWWVTWTTGGDARTRREWAAKAREMIGRDAYDRGRWPW